MASQDAESLRLDQFLFGYRDGHRQLAGSRKLPDEVSSTLLLYSDLAPGLSGAFSPYWTALPVMGAKAFALLRTWPAPEMPRPGCVWTHAILIPFADLAQIRFLTNLRALFQRPDGEPSKIEMYAETITLSPSHTSGPSDVQLGSVTVLPLVSALYNSQPGTAVVTAGPAVDDAIFALWSQQWPRLRRTFSFQTASTDYSSPASVFDLTTSKRPVFGMDAVPGIWEIAASQDIAAGGGPLRDFLWKYATDIEDGKLAYQTLVGVFLCTANHRLSTPKEILEHVGTVFPEQTEARTLKKAMLGVNGASILGVTAVDAFNFLSFREHTTAFGLPSDDLLLHAAREWSSSGSILATAAMRMLDWDEIGHRDLIDALTNGVDLSTLIAAGHKHEPFLRALLLAKPALLSPSQVLGLHSNEMAILATAVPDEKKLVAAALDSLFYVDNEEVAGIFSGRFPEQVCQKVFHSLASSLASGSREVPNAWISSIRDYLYQATLSTVFDHCEKQSELAACALVLQLNVPTALQRSSSEWAEKLARCLPDLEGASRQRLLAFMLAIALARPKPGCETIFETCFEAVHEDIAVSRLPYDAFNALAEYLPQLYYRDQWDTCLRLRLAVVSTYVREGLSLKSFGKLSRDPTIQGWLIDLAKNTSSGRQYLKGR